MDSERKIDLSIIIPAFNAEKYLGRCLKSVFRAVFLAGGGSEGVREAGSTGDLVNTRGLTGATRVVSEILVIDNGSGDKTLLVADKWQKEAEALKKAGANIKFKVFSCEKTGASAARNFGFSKAQGEFVWFIDADDAITEEAIVKLIAEARGARGQVETGANKGAESNARADVGKKITPVVADLVMMGVERIYADGHRDYLSAVRVDEPDFKSRFVRYGAGPWQFLIRRAWWQEHGFSFHEGIIHEDMELISSLILYTDYFTSVDEPLYLYYQNAGSVLHKSEFNPHIFDIFLALEGLYRRFEQVPTDATAQGITPEMSREKSRGVSAADEFCDELEWFFIWNLLIDSAKDFGAFREGRVGFSRARKMLRDYFPEWRRNRFLAEKPLKLRVRVMLNYYRWR